MCKITRLFGRLRGDVRYFPRDFSTYVSYIRSTLSVRVAGNARRLFYSFGIKSGGTRKRSKSLRRNRKEKERRKKEKEKKKKKEHAESIAE